MSEKEQMISKIEKTSEQIHNYWKGIKGKQVGQIEESWNDYVCNEYIKEVNKVDRIVNQIIDRLEELKEFWESKEEVEEEIVQEV